MMKNKHKMEAKEYAISNLEKNCSPTQVMNEKKKTKRWKESWINNFHFISTFLFFNSVPKIRVIFS